MRAVCELDLVFVDGCHGFPSPIIDRFTGAASFEEGGIVVFDDVQLPQVFLLLSRFGEPDGHGESVAGTMKWKAFRRMSEGSLGEDWYSQPFFPKPSSAAGTMRRLKDFGPLGIKEWMRR